MIRQWIAEKLIALGVKLLDIEKIVEDIKQEPEPVEEDWDIAVHPAVTLGPKAIAMLEYARMVPPPKKKKVIVPLRGSIQDRVQRARRSLGR